MSTRVDSVRMKESDEEQFVVVACLLAEEEELEKKAKKGNIVFGYTTYARGDLNMENITPYFLIC